MLRTFRTDIPSRSLGAALCRAAFLALCATCALGLAACGGADDSQRPGARFSVAIVEPSSLLPANFSSIYDREVILALFTPLVDADPRTGEPRLAAAQSIESEDNRTWRVKLRQGATFHNGETLTAESFVDAWNFAANPENAQVYAQLFERIEGYGAVAAEKADSLSGLKVVDDENFTVTLKKPYSQFVAMVSHPAFAPLPLDAIDDPEAFNEAPIGNGPFKMNGRWEHDKVIRLDRFEDYAGAKARAGGVDFRIYQDPRTAYNDVLAGGVDVMQELPNSALAGAQAEFGDRYVAFTGGRLEFLGFPLEGDKFTDPRARRAVSMAIDRQAIASTLFSDTRTPATGYVPPVVDGVAEDACGAACRYDAAAAKQLLQEAGGVPGGGFSIAYNADAADNKQWVEAVARQLSQALDIEVTAKAYPTLAVFLEDLAAGKVDMAYRNAHTFSYPSMSEYLDPLFAEGSPANYSGYANPRFDALMDEAAAAQDLDAANAAYRDAEQLVLADMPHIPLWHQKTAGAHSAQVSNVMVDPFRRVRVEQIIVEERGGEL